MENGRGNLAKNTFMLSVCTLLNKGLLFVMIPLFSRWLTVEEYGSYDVLSTYISLLIPILTLACSNAVFRLSVDKDDVKFKKFYISNGFFIISVNLVLSVVIITTLSIFFRWDNYIAFILLMLGEVLDNYFQGYLRAIKKLNIFALCKTATVVFTALMVTVLVKICSLGLNGILLGYAFGFYISELINIFFTQNLRYFSLKDFSIQGVKELVSYSYALIPNDISWWVINVSDRTIIKLILGATANGIYAIAYKVPNLCTAVFGVFNISWQEAAIDVINDKDRSFYFNEIYNKMISILISLCAGILSCNFILFDYIFDIKYSDARLYTPILVTAIIFSILSQFFGGIQISLKRPEANGFTTVTGAVVNLVVHLALVWFVGLYAAAVSTLAANFVVAVLRKRLLRNEFSFSVSYQNRILTIIYVYFVVVAFLKTNIVLSLVNLFLAAILFIYVNKDYAFKILRKLRGTEK